MLFGGLGQIPPPQASQNLSKARRKKTAAILAAPEIVIMPAYGNGLWQARMRELIRYALAPSTAWMSPSAFTPNGQHAQAMGARRSQTSPMLLDMDAVNGTTDVALRRRCHQSRRASAWQLNAHAQLGDKAHRHDAAWPPAQSIRRCTSTALMHSSATPKLVGNIVTQAFSMPLAE